MKLDRLVHPRGRDASFRWRSARGFTLVEMMVVMIIAGVVTFGLIGFYLNSQATWLDASSQALAQRDATSIVERIASRVSLAGSVAIVANPPDTVVFLYPAGSGTAFHRFWWSGTDSLLHEGQGALGDDGPVVPSRVQAFSVATDPAHPMLHLTRLHVRSATGQIISVQTTFAMYNAP